MAEFNLIISEQDLQILSDIVTNSTPKSSFGVVNTFIQKIDKQIFEQVEASKQSPLSVEDTKPGTAQ